MTRLAKNILINLTDAPIYTAAIEAALRQDFLQWLQGTKTTMREQFTVQRLIRPSIEYLKGLELDGDGIALKLAELSIDTRPRKGAVYVARDYVTREITPLVDHFNNTRKRTTKRWSTRLVIIVALALYGQSILKMAEHAPR